LLVALACAVALIAPSVARAQQVQTPLIESPSVVAQTSTTCQAIKYVFGFATLYSVLADWMGDPVTCEFTDPNGTGDVHQRTTVGLAFWRKSTNTPTFTNGNEHWALVGRGMVYWTGSSIDPSSDAIAFDATHPCLTTGGCQSTGIGLTEMSSVAVAQPTSSAAALSDQVFETHNGPRTASQLRDELARTGYGGPWDVSSMLAAYGRATSPSPQPAQQPTASAPTPVPTATRDFGRECESFANTLPGKIGNKILLSSNIVLNCTFYANRDGVAGLACYQNVLNRELTDAIIYTPADFNSRYTDCLSRLG
jgi:hypothetical protein